MKHSVASMAGAVLVVLGLLGLFTVPASADDYAALKGVQSVKTIFDFRDGNPETALIHLKLVHDTYKDQAILAITKKPEFVVVFMDVSVLVLSSNRENFTADEKTKLAEFDKTIKAMAQDGIRLEVCLFAAKSLKVDPETIAPEIHRVGNGWIASMGYQQQGYSVIPAY